MASWLSSRLCTRHRILMMGASSQSLALASKPRLIPSLSGSVWSNKFLKGSRIFPALSELTAETVIGLFCWLMYNKQSWKSSCAFGFVVRNQQTLQCEIMTNLDNKVESAGRYCIQPWLWHFAYLISGNPVNTIALVHTYPWMKWRVRRTLCGKDVA